MYIQCAYLHKDNIRADIHVCTCLLEKKYVYIQHLGLGVDITIIFLHKCEYVYICNVTQCNAMQCNVMQCNVVSCNVM